MTDANQTERDAPRILACEFCGCKANESDAIIAGWQPYFWINATTEAKGPACPACSAEHLEGFDVLDEPMLKPGHAVPAKPAGPDRS